ncbi:hypothetical protein CYMTET_19211 [Cymbomonas tetramitiformis]|uniref:Uncharacterized protein n=1 Tax=Cymbomonas tetramitiformis TaxID=36881 RepID=A0AAE0L5G3_9CHLO|nr:hypothetical protein CYMTET_19211 [Cymbomonas tetramitiformis]
MSLAEPWDNRTMDVLTANEKVIEPTGESLACPGGGRGTAAREARPKRRRVIKIQGDKEEPPEEGRMEQARLRERDMETGRTRYQAPTPKGIRPGNGNF